MGVILSRPQFVNNARFGIGFLEFSIERYSLSPCPSNLIKIKAKMLFLTQLSCIAQIQYFRFSIKWTGSDGVSNVDDHNDDDVELRSATASVVWHCHHLFSPVSMKVGPHICSNKTPFLFQIANIDYKHPHLVI